MSVGRVLTEIFGVSEFFYRKCVKNKSRSGTPKIEDFGSFFRKKRVFGVADFSEKLRKRFFIVGGHLNFSFHKYLLI